MSALYAWLRRHPRLVDGVLALILAVGGIGGGLGLHFALTLGLTVPVVFRRGHPVEAFITAIAFGAAQVALGLQPTAADLAIVVLLYTLAAYTTRRISVIGLIICLVGSAVEVIRWHPPTVVMPSVSWLGAGSILLAGPSLISWVLGDSMRYRRAYYAGLEERAAQLERDRDAQAQIAAAAERARIARELHDVVAHNVSVMVVQADGAAYAMDADPSRVREALAAISTTGRQALTEMRVLLGVLRRANDGQQAVLAPQPGINQLEELLDQARSSGLPVSCRVEGEPQPLAGGTALAAYRIVQESLTNTRRHAGPAAQACVVLRYDKDVLELAITDDGLGGAAPCDGAGHGLTGMRERAAMYGGSLDAGPLDAGGFQVTARLPIAPGWAARAEVAGAADTSRAGAS